MLGRLGLAHHNPLHTFVQIIQFSQENFNPGEVSDRQLAPSRALVKPSPQPPTG